MRRLLGVLAIWLFGVTAFATEIPPDDVEAFADGVMASTMLRDHVAGAVVGVVADGKVVLLKGYGYSDVDGKQPVDPRTTLFRPGSVTKLFTWVALMQLHEQGLVDFDTDVNQYLEGVHVPDTFPQPITIKHLMTHTPGFEDHVIGLFGRDADSVRPLTELLNEQMPARVRPPGEYASYSNHGVGIAGLIVEQVSGEPWADYIEHHITGPLNMAYTTVRQPLPEGLQPHMSKGYTWEAGKYREKSFEYVPVAPAGSSSASAADMLHLLQAFLNGGEYNGVRILSERANHEMQQILFRAVPNTNGLMHGFYETSSNGQLILGHGGDTLWFHSELMLMPEAGVGWFISTNTASGPRARSAFHRGFLQRYFGTPASMAEPFEKTDLTRLVGSYGALRHAYTDFTKMAQLLSPINIAVGKDGQLMMAAGDQVGYYEEAAPLVFRHIYTGDKITFAVDEAGNGTHLYIDAAPVVAFERLSGVDSPRFHMMLLTITMAVFLWVIVVWTIRYFTRRWVLPEAVARFRISAWWLSLSVVLMLLALSVTIGDPNSVVFGLSGASQFALLIPYVVMTLAVITLLLYLPLISAGDVGRIGKLGYLLVAASGIGFTWFMYYWQLL